MPLKQLLTHRKQKYQLPMFLPVYQPKSNLITVEDLKNRFAIDGMIVNGFFLYKDAAVREKFETGLTLHDYIGFDGLIMTDSGAFQGLKRPLYLSNKKIVLFQDAIKADIVSPLDLISPPGDNYKTAEKKLLSTCKRIREAKNLVQNGILAGVQQGGRFLDLRRKSIEDLLEIGVEYIAVGSLVPFFNKNHNLSTIIKIMRDIRSIAGKELPVHIYGAGDPVELPFLAALGADIFDSSSYGHYATAKYYMTPYGALTQQRKEEISTVACTCDTCNRLAASDGIMEIFNDPAQLAAHNLSVILATIEDIRAAIENDKLEDFLVGILEKHIELFPNSLLNSSWESGLE